MQNGKTKKIKWALSFCGVIVVALLASVIAFFAIQSQNKLSTVKIDNTDIHVEIATTSQEQAQGLCCRSELAYDHGMLFVYSRPDIYKFWMKDTRIPLDMYWIDTSKQIIHIEHNIQPSTYPKTFGPEKVSLYVLETNGGFAKKHSIEIGDRVEFDL